MNLDAKVISKEVIKPSSPTPPHLRHYQLSFLDQISPPVHNPLILFYPTSKHADNDPELNNIQKSNRLKQSLSKVLTYYYPLAGRIKDNLFVECNDEGIPYVEAQVLNYKLSNVIENPLPEELNKLVPFELDSSEDLPLGVQFNVFECGGIAIGLCISHKLGDASSFFTFLRTWAATSRGSGVQDIPPPEFISATLFPPKNISGFDPRIGITKKNVVTKRFVFNASSINALKSQYALKNERPPSRVEALSVFLWSRFMASTKARSDCDDGQSYFMLHAVNLRPRTEPPLPEHSFGNYYRTAITFPSHEGECNISQVRESIRTVDKNYVKMLQEGNEYLELLKQQSRSFTSGKMVTLNFTSLCGFPSYEADFGWTKPTWVGSPGLTFANLVVFMETASGDGIEALVHLMDDDMVRFQQDEVLLQFVAPTTF